MQLQDRYPIEILLDGTRRVRWLMQPIMAGDAPYEIVIDVLPDGRIAVNNKLLRSQSLGVH